MKRLAYGARGEESVFPLDGGLNLPKDSDPHGLGERLVFEVARGSLTSAKGSIPARTISSNTVRCCTTTAISPRVSPSLPALSKGPAATSSKTAWTSPGHTGRFTPAAIRRPN